MNGTFENMIRRYSEELLKMNREKTLQDPTPELIPAVSAGITQESADDENADGESGEREKEDEADEKAEDEETPTEEREELRQDISDISGIENTDFYNGEGDVFPPFSLEEPESFAFFRAQVFTGSSAYPIENARVLIIKDDMLFTLLSTDGNGRTKRVKLPSYPEINSLEPGSTEQYVEYRAEVYAKGFTPEKNLLVSAVGGSDIILDVQMIPLDERVK